MDKTRTIVQNVVKNSRFAMPVTAANGTAYSPGVSSKVLAPNSSGTSIVQIVNGLGQAGGIWGNPSNEAGKKNYISTDKKQVISMWLAMTSYNGDTNKADGLSFCKMMIVVQMPSPVITTKLTLVKL